MAATPRRDPALLERARAVYTAVVSDELDKMGYRDQVMRPDIRPLVPEARLCGYAHTVLCVPVYSLPDEPYKLEMASVDAVKRNDVICVSRTDGSFWGELLSTAATYRGSRGIVIDGYTRDTQAIIEMGFPTFVRGIYMADSLGRIDVSAFGVPVVCGGVTVHPGDLILGDYDGVVVVPNAIAEEAITRAEAKARGENQVREQLAQGMSVEEAFRRFGIL